MNNKVRKNSLPTFLIILLLVVKLPILLSLSGIAMTINYDELYYGLLAKELVGGTLSLPLFDYQLRGFEGGGLVEGVLAAGFFKIFGDSLFSLKLVSILFSIGILFILYVFLSRFFSDRIAFFACLLFIVPPRLLAERSFMAFGNHYESIFFTLLFVFIFYEIFFNHNEKSKPLFLCLGCIGGFGIYFSYIFLITLAACLFLWFAIDRKCVLKQTFFIFLVGLLIGLSPWIYYNVNYGFTGIFVKDEVLPLHFFKTGILSSLQKLKGFIIYDVPRSFFFEQYNTVFNKLIASFYYGLFLLSLSILFWRNRRSISYLTKRALFLKCAQCQEGLSREVLFLVYPIFFALVFSFSDFSPENDFRIYKTYRYFPPLSLFMLIAISLFLNTLITQYKRSLRGRCQRSVTYFLMVVLCAIGTMSNASLASSADFGRVLIYKGYSYSKIGYFIGKKFQGEDVAAFIDTVNKFNSQIYKHDCYYGFGWKCADLFQERLEAAVHLFEAVENKYKSWCYYGLGARIGSKIHNFDLFKQWLIKAKAMPEEYRRYFIEGIGTQARWIFNAESKGTNQLIINILDDRSVMHFYKGLASGFDNSIPSARYSDIINLLPAKLKPEIYEGFGIGIADALFFDDWPQKALHLIEGIDKKYQPYCYKGLGIEIANVFADDINKCIDLINFWVNERYRHYCYEGLYRGMKGGAVFKLGFKIQLQY